MPLTKTKRIVCMVRKKEAAYRIKADVADVAGLIDNIG